MQRRRIPHRLLLRPRADVAPVQPILLVLSAILIPILVTAFVVLYVAPGLGEDVFAWSIGPLMSSMMLGATYLGGAYFFVVVIRSRQWRHVWLGLLPIAVFAGTLGIATLLHWELFDHDRLGFQLWAVLYFVVPVILPVLWYRNHRITSVRPIGRAGELPDVIRWAFAGLGASLVIAGVLLFLLPEQLLQYWPWTLSPLTTRVMAAIYLLPGLVGLSIAYDGSWSATRYLLQAQAVTLILMLIAVFVARANFDWSAPGSWGFSAGLVAILVLLAITYWSMERAQS